MGKLSPEMTVTLADVFAKARLLQPKHFVWMCNTVIRAQEKAIEEEEIEVIRAEKYGRDVEKAEGDLVCTRQRLAFAKALRGLLVLWDAERDAPAVIAAVRAMWK